MNKLFESVHAPMRATGDQLDLFKSRQAAKMSDGAHVIELTRKMRGVADSAQREKTDSGELKTRLEDFTGQASNGDGRSPAEVAASDSARSDVMKLTAEMRGTSDTVQREKTAGGKLKTRLADFTRKVPYGDGRSLAEVAAGEKVPMGVSYFRVEADRNIEAERARLNRSPDHGPVSDWQVTVVDPGYKARRAAAFDGLLSHVRTPEAVIAEPAVAMAGEREGESLLHRVTTALGKVTGGGRGQGLLRRLGMATQVMDKGL